MEKTEKRPHITVETKRNGYALQVDNNDFLYFKANDLIVGMMYHVTIGVDSDAYISSMSEIIKNAEKIRETYDKRINSMKHNHKKKVEQLEAKISKLKEQIAELNS